MRLVVGTIICVTVVTVLIALIAWILDRSTARHEGNRNNS